MDETASIVHTVSQGEPPSTRNVLNSLADLQKTELVMAAL